MSVRVLPSLDRVRARCNAIKDEARRQAVLLLQPHLEVEFYLSGWVSKAQQAYADQWCPNPRHPSGGWDWPEVFRRHNDPHRLDVVIWGPQERLCGLGLCLSSSQAVEIRFVEGDNRQDCPLQGKRALIVLECATCYAQASGKKEIRIQPVNQALETLYRDIYRFRLETKGHGQAYYVKSV